MRCMGGGLLHPPPPSLPAVPHLVIRISMLIPVQIQIRIQIGIGSYPNFHLPFTLIGKSNFYTFSHCYADLQCFIFLVSVNCVINLKNFWQHIEILWKKVNFLLPGIDTDPDRHALDVDPDPDPAKWCGSDPIRIRIHNTNCKINKHYAWISIMNSGLSEISFCPERKYSKNETF